MSVKVIKKEGGVIEITLDNGHAQALEKVTKDFSILSEEKAVGFMLSVMRDADGKSVKTINGSFVPADEIKKPLETTEEIKSNEPAQ